MARTTGLFLVVMMVLVAGCTGVFGGQETTTGATIPTPAGTDAPAATAADTSASTSPPESTDAGTPTATPASTATSASTAANVQSYTLFNGGNPRSNTSLGPQTFVAGEPLAVNVSIANRKNRRINYTTVIQLARINGTGPDAAITERQRLGQFTTSLEPGTNRTVTRTVTPNMTGQKLFLWFLLYESDPPATPTTANAEMYFGVPITVNGSA
jgi:pyruvate/2-oxoglutarate dehydrogenase complex dihydrolipoamide acyltransferase (E2) component